MRAWEKHTGEQQYASQLLSGKWKTFYFLNHLYFEFNMVCFYNIRTQKH